MNRPGRPLVTRAAVAVVAAAALGVLATGAVDPRGWSLAGAVVAQRPTTGEVDLGGRPSVLVCPPAPRLVSEVGAAAADEDFRAESPARTATVLRTVGGPAVSARTLPAGEEPSAGLDGARAGDGTLVATDGRLPVALQAGPEATVGALAVHVADDGDLAGLAASSCGFPTESAVLVGGGVEPGRSGRVVLSNPGTTTATVDLVLFTPQGPVSPPAAQDLAVPGGTSRDLLLEGLVEPTPALAVGVTARGGAVVAHLVDTRISGVRAQGVEQVVGTTPSTSLTLAGLVPSPRATTTLRLANPGTSPAAVGWQVLGPDGAIGGTAPTVATVPAGSVVEVPLDDLPDEPPTADSLLAVRITSDLPVAGAVTTRIERAGGLADLAVVGSWGELRDRALVPLPVDDAVVERLVLAAAAAVATVEVTSLGDDGEPLADPVVVDVAPGRTLTLATDEDAAALLLDASGPVTAAVLLQADSGPATARDFVSVVPVTVPSAAPDSVVVGPLSPDVLRAPVLGPGTSPPRARS